VDGLCRNAKLATSAVDDPPPPSPLVDMASLVVDILADDVNVKEFTNVVDNDETERFKSANGRPQLMRYLIF